MEKLPNLHLRKLKSAGQTLEPLLKMGRAGLSDGFIQTVNEALEFHELVKVKFDEFKDQKKELAKDIASKTSSHLILQVGHVVVLYREQPDAAKRKIRPGSDAPIGRRQSP
jgi:RNA-binding protein